MIYTVLGPHHLIRDPLRSSQPYEPHFFSHYCLLLLFGYYISLILLVPTMFPKNEELDCGDLEDIFSLLDK